MSTLNRIMRIAEIAILFAGVYLMLVAVRTLHRIDAELDDSQKKLNALVSTVDKTIQDVDTTTSQAERDLNAQLSQTNRTLAATSDRLVAQTAQLNQTIASASASLALTQAKINTVLDTTNLTVAEVKDTTIPGLNKVIQDPNIPKLVQDGRRTTVFAAQTMSHLDATANEIAKAAPDITKHIDGISKDMNKLTTKITAPKSKWQKFLSVLAVAGGLAGPLKSAFGL